MSDQIFSGLSSLCKLQSAAAAKAAMPSPRYAFPSGPLPDLDSTYFR